MMTAFGQRVCKKPGSSAPPLFLLMCTYLHLVHLAYFLQSVSIDFLEGRFLLAFLKKLFCISQVENADFIVFLGNRLISAPEEFR